MGYFVERTGSYWKRVGNFRREKSSRVHACHSGVQWSGQLAERPHVGEWVQLRRCCRYSREQTGKGSRGGTVLRARVVPAIKCQREDAQDRQQRLRKHITEAPLLAKASSRRAS